MEARILGFGIKNAAHGNRNPTNDWNPEPKFHWQRLKYNTFNPELRQPCSGCWHFLEGQYFTPSKARYFGQITMFSPFSSNKPTRASISSLSEATHDCVVYNPLKWVFTSLTQEFKGKNCERSGYLVDTSHALVQCTAKEHENCDVTSNQRPFHLCIVCFQPIGAQRFEILSMHVHAFSSSTVYL